MKSFLKSALHWFSLFAIFPFAFLSGFGRFEPIYLIGAHCLGLVPGLPGDYLRSAWYRMTLEKCSPQSRIQFGSFFAHPQARVGEGVYIGSYCVLGRTLIGDRTQIASGVQILSGKRQHRRDDNGKILGSEEGIFTTVSIGSDCWIGAGAIVMADVGSGTTVGAGSVVTAPVPPGSVAVGNPARVIKSLNDRLT